MTFWTSRDDLGEPATDRGSSPAGPRAWNLDLFRQGRRVLVVENDVILADDLRRELDRQGARVVGPATSVAEAQELLRSGPRPDVAILDVFLDDEVAYPVAEALRGRGIPFVLALNRLAWTIPRAYADVPRVEKPVDMRRLARALAERTARP